jgi:hypothetical protein
MTFNRPVNFEAAMELNAVKTALPTTLNSAQYRALGGDILRRAQFSAGVQNAQFLDQVGGVATDLAAGRTDYATARVMLQQARQGITEESFLDDARLNLILKTQRETAQGYGQFIEGMAEGVIDAFPAAELYRLEEKKDPRNWEQRWTIAAQVAGDTDALRMLQSGRMIALKDSGIWQELGNGAGGYEDTLGNPYPPFAFMSGMDVRDVARSEAIELGLLDPAEKVQPQEIPGFNDALEQPLALRSAALQDAILKQFGDFVDFIGGVLRLKAAPLGAG